MDLYDIADEENEKVEETVSITKKEYKRLKDDSLFLGCLFAQGLDNWQGYELALEEHEENRGEKY